MRTAVVGAALGVATGMTLATLRDDIATVRSLSEPSDLEHD